MIQRIQSLYLAAGSIAMIAFLRAVVWVKVDLDAVLTMKPYALITPANQYIIFPYGLSAVFICCFILTAVYAIVRYDNRKVQLRIITGMNLTFVVWVTLNWALVQKANGTYLVHGYGSYAIGMVLPFIALIANLLARHFIKKDEQLVHEDHLR